jgi:hemoglobin
VNQVDPIVRTDISDRADLERLMREFYRKAFADPEIGFIFTEVTHLDLTTHLPLIVDFWSTVLFATGDYRGQPSQVHQDVHEKVPLTAARFDRWVLLFSQTVDELFVGPKAKLAKQRARYMSAALQVHLRRQ